MGLVDDRAPDVGGRRRGQPADEPGDEGVQVDDVGPQLATTSGAADGSRRGSVQGFERTMDQSWKVDAVGDAVGSSGASTWTSMPRSDLLGREVAKQRDHAAPVHLADVQHP